MARIKCPNCALEAILVEKGTDPEAIVDCSNCHTEYLLKELL